MPNERLQSTSDCSHPLRQTFNFETFGRFPGSKFLTAFWNGITWLKKCSLAENQFIRAHIDQLPSTTSLVALDGLQFNGSWF